jgi:hypothetical protein
MSTRSIALFDAISSDLGRDVMGLSHLAFPPPDADYRLFSGVRLATSILSKWAPDSSEELDRLCLEKFLACNSKCSTWKLPELSCIEDMCFNEMKRIIDDFLNPGGLPLIESNYDLIRNGRVGPGSARGARSTSFYSKFFASPLTCTREDLYTEYRGYTRWFDSWSDAEENRSATFGQYSLSDGSLCCFVPKTSKISRMICVEPSLNMFYQLGLGRILEDRLRSAFKSDLSTLPSINVALAKRGSQDGSFSTIDLASASDSVSMNLCKALFPSWFYLIMRRLRSPAMAIDSDLIKLNMMSTMGNGFTFPLQTLIFSSLIRAVYRVIGREINDFDKNWSCFGDDLVVCSDAYSLVVTMLSKLGFTVNDSKSFFEGPFRESCGADFFRGQPCRPVYIRALDTTQDIMVAINLLNRWSALTGILLRNAVQYLYSLVPDRFRSFLVPYTESDDAGIKVPLSYLQLRKYDRNGTLVYKYFSPKSTSYVVGDANVAAPRGHKKLIFNPTGLLCSFLYGEVRNRRILVRHDKLFYRARQRCIPFWDYRPDGVYDGKTPKWQQWETAVHFNVQPLA